MAQKLEHYSTKMDASNQLMERIVYPEWMEVSWYDFTTKNNWRNCYDGV